MSELVIEGFHLSLQQKRLWLLRQDEDVYLSQCAVEVDARLRADEIRAAFLAAADRHEILRTTYHCLAGMDLPIQVIGEEPSFVLRTVRSGETVDTVLSEDRAFDLGDGPLARLTLIETGGARNVLAVSLPSICLDPESLKILVGEMLRAVDAAAEPVQYADFSEWQNGLLEEDSDREIRTYWEDALRRLPTLPFRRRGAGSPGFAPRSHRLDLDPALTAGAEDLARANGFDLPVVLLAAWQALVARLTGEADFTLGVLVDGRSFEQLQGALGPFAKYLPVRCAGAEDFSFAETLEILRIALQDARERQNLFSWELERREKGAEALPVAFDFSDWRDVESRGGLRLLRHHTCGDRAELRLACVRSEEGLRAEIVHDGALFDEALARLLPARLDALLRSALADPQRPLWALDVLGEEERRQILVDWNATSREVPLAAGLAQRFRQQAAATPEAPALEWAGSSLSFRELDRRTDLLARHLVAAGVGPDSVVALLMERGLGQIVGLLAVLKAGGAYLPLDPHQPLPRLEGMLEDAGSRVVVGEARFREDLAGSRRWLDLDPSGEVAEEGEPEAQLPARWDPDSLAYVIFTSGSTGRPKGVMIRQGSVLNLAAALSERVYDGAGERLKVSLNAPLSFDASVKQWVQLLAGHCLVVVPEEVRPDGPALLELLESSGVEVLDCTPSQLHLLLDAGLEQAGTALRLLLIGGEAIPPGLWERLAKWPQARCVNVYGPTECTVDTTAHPLAGAAAPVLGCPLPNVRTYLVDPRFQPVPIGAAGELCVGGEGLARGYLGRPALTAERFVPDPFGGVPGSRLYRTGDLARQGTEGWIEFLGRVDHQVKIRGYRIELGEIEAALRRHPGVEEAVVVLREDQPDRQRLVAYAMPRRRFARRIEGRTRRDLPNGLAVVEQNRNETEYLYDEIFVKESYTRHGVHLPEGACVLDVGANIGMFTVFVQSRCPTARIYAFEPIGPIYETLRINCELYGQRARLFPFGLSEQERTEAFLYYPRYSMMSGQKEYARPEQEVEVIRRYLQNEGEGSSSLLTHVEELLDGRFEGEVCHARLRRLSDVLAEEGIDRVDLLKVDVQRAELDVLRGLDEEDWPRIGQVVMEVHDSQGEETEGRAHQIGDWLTSRGFSVVIEQDELLVGTDRYQLYAVRPDWPAPSDAVEAPKTGPGAAILEAAELREHLRQQLPDYMLPAAIVLLDELPLTRNGKVNRAALPPPEEEGDASARKGRAPRTAFEEMLAGIWAEVLGVPQVGADESFFDLGGHSLLATQLISRVREHFQVELSLRSFFEGPTPEQLALRVEEAIRAGRTPELPPIRPVPRTGDLPLSFSQQRLWFLHQLDPGSALYNSAHALRIEGPLDPGAVRKVLTEIARRQEALRTVFPSTDGDPVQRILPAAELPVALIDLSALPEGPRDGELRRLVDDESRRPFDLEHGPLLRVWMARLGEAEHAVMFAQHHIVSDAWSMGILSREVAALYPRLSQGLPSPLPELEIQYADYASWQRSWLRGEALEAQLDYWRGRLGRESVPLALPFDRPRSAAPGFRGGSEGFNLDPVLAERLRGLARREGATLFMVLLAAFQSLLHRYSGQEEIRVGTPIAGRSRLELEGLIGFFINTLVLRADLSGDPSFRSALARVRGEALGAYAHQDLPFEKLVDDLAPDRSLAVSPLFQVMFSLQNVPLESLEVPGLRLGAMPRETHWAPFDLTLVLSEVGAAVGGELQYAAELFDAATARRLLGHLRNLIDSAVSTASSPEQPLSELALLDAAERGQLLAVWSGAGEAAPEGPCLHQLFEAQVEQRPAAPAIVTSEGAISYRELDRSAGELARLLTDLGVGPEARVALCLGRTPELAVAILGTLKAGGAFVPLDPSYPPERLRTMLAMADALVLLTSGERAEDLSGTGARVIRLDAPLPAAGAGVLAAPDPDAAAYVIFTSGSTGLPKGVVAPHRAVAGYALDMARRFGLGPGDRVLQFASPAFDVLIEELFPAWASGAAVAFEREESLASPVGLERAIETLGVTALELPASYWREWVDELAAAGRRPPESVRLLILGSEKPSLDHLQVWQGFGVRTINIFGLTETTITSSLYPVPPGPLAGRDLVDLPIGPPVAIARVYVVDRRLEPVPAGVAGELLIGGAGVARGYLGRPDLTAGRFVPDLFADTPGARLYRTGDLARFRADGALEFLGRIDDQVKIRGFRIEPGEVEAHLGRHPAVRQAVVLAREDERGERRLVAYVVPEASGASAAELRAYLRGLLPEHLVPSQFVSLDAIPLTPNGKIDRRALPAPRFGSEGRGAGLAPATPVEEMLAAVWSEVLGVESPARDDSFFDLGGHSLLATRLVGRVRRLFGIEIPLRSVFEHPTLSAMSARIDAAFREGDGTAAPLIGRVARDGELPLSFAQQRLWFFDQLEPGSPVYNVASALRIEGPLDVPVLAAALREVVRRHESLRTSFDEVDGRPVQRIGSGGNVVPRQIDLSGLPVDLRESVVRSLAAEEARRAFDLARGPLLRVSLLRGGADEHTLLFTLHHIVSDEWSAEILVRELSVLYETLRLDLPAKLPELPIQYADFAAWQRGWLQGEVLEGELEHWRLRLQDSPPELALPTDRPRPPIRTFHGAVLPVHLGAETSRKLRQAGRQEGTTLFMTLLAAFQALLARWCGQRDVSVGTPIAGRSRVETEGLIGFFVNTLVLRADLSEVRTFRELLGQVRETALGAYAHQDLPFERLVDELAPERALSRNPLFQTFFSLTAARPRTPEISGLRLKPLEGRKPAAKFDLELALADRPEGIQGLLVYSTDLFDTTTMARLAARLGSLADALASAPESDLWDLDLLGEVERHQVLVEWSAVPGAWIFEPVQETFSRQALRRPGETALEWEGGSLTYGELESRSNRLARHLIGLGIRPEVPVGVMLERSPDLVVALLAVLKSGGAFVPLDPELPAARLDLLREEGGVRLVLSPQGLADSSEDDQSVGLRSQAGDLAYQIYTSGTTGRPKAVMVEHGSLSWLLWAAARQFGWSETDRMPCLAPFSFDIFLFELLSPLLAGGTSVLFPIRPAPDVPRLVSELERCTALHAVPALMRQVADEAIARGGVTGLRTVFVGGDAVPADLLTDLGRAFPGARVRVLYGPTEGTILSTSHEASDDPRPLLGRPLAGAVVEILDAGGRPAPIGVAGEIGLGGPGVSRGYRGRPGLTADRYQPTPAGRRYRTGDLGRWLADGRLEFLGRVDEQVKVRGFRIEPGEVEAALRQCPGVREAVVVALAGEGGGKRLVAYVVPDDSGAPELDALRLQLGRSLPDYMVPSAFVTLGSLPLTAHGKVDRRRLPAPGPVSAAGEAPRTPVEETLARIWSEVLGLQSVDIHQSFFSLGGDSILSIRVVAKARQHGIHLTPKQVFLHPTIAGLAQVASTAPETSGDQGLVSGEALLTPIQQRFFALGLHRPDHFNQSLLLTSREELIPGALERAIARLIEHHDALRFRYERRGEGWIQRYAPPGETPFLHADLSALPASRRREEIETAAEDVQRSLDLAAGPILRFALFSLGGGERQRLLAVVHHLVVDGVSWRLLLEDLETAYRQGSRGEAIVLPAKTCSFKEWSERLGRQAEPDTGGPAVLPVDLPGGDNRVGDSETLTVSLSPEETRALLEEVPDAYRTGIDAILLAGLAEPLASFAGTKSFVVEVEGHGRDALDGIDPSRTVGWLTAAFPVTLEADGDPGSSIKRVKERLRSARTSSPSKPQVSFNYLGRLDRALPESSPFEPAPESKGMNQDPRDPREHVLEIGAAVTGDRLGIHWTYSRNLHRRETIAALAERFLASLRGLIDHCRAAESGGYTPSDFPLSGLGQRELDRLLGAERGIEDVYPLSPLQQGMLFHSVSTPGAQAYFEQLSFRLSGELDPVAFRQAWQRVVDRHPILRSSFLWEGLREPLQVVRRRVELSWEEEDWRGAPEPERRLRQEDRLAADRARGFDVARAPLMRLLVARLDSADWWVVWSHHHLLLDGWSLSVVFRDVLASYEALRDGTQPDLPAPRPYRDYIAWLREQDPASSERYWSGAMQGFDAPTPLPADRPAMPGLRSEADAEVRDRLPGAWTAGLAALARRQGTTLHILVQAAWSLLLARYSGDRRVVFGTVLSGRPPELAGVESMLGLFINTLPVRADVPERSPLSAWLALLQERHGELAQHQHDSLAAIRRWTEVPSGAPLFESLFVFENYPVDETLKPPAALALQDLRTFETVDLPLALTVAPGPELRLRVQYARSRFDAATVQRLAGHLKTLLTAMHDSPESDVWDLGLLGEAERHQVLVEWSTVPGAWIFEPVQETFARQALRRPGEVALEWEGGRLTYGELESRSNRLARHLIGLGAGPEVPVGVMLERSPDLVVALLAVLKSGGAFVPLDPELPSARLDLLREEGGVRLVLSPKDLDTAEQDDQPVGLRSQAGDLAYQIYTSGTTGRPKAVMVEHGSLSWLLWTTARQFGWSETDRMPCLAPFSFDIFLFELLSPLLAGGTSVLIPIRPAPDVPRLVSELERCTALHAVPALMRQVADEAIARGGVKSLRTVFVGGDAVPADLLADLGRAFPVARVRVLYGPTEGTILSTSHEASDDPRPLLGQPLAGAVVEVLDGGGRPAPIGVAGEICLGGPGVSRGYRGRPGLTAERYEPTPAGRRYRTGDLGRWLADGRLEFLGRVDEQVKVRGFRIEPGEVEAALRQCPGVREAVVVALSGEGTGKRLVAYVVPDESGAPSPEALRLQLACSLPDYMVPSAFVTLESLPLTAHGKVDRRRLPAPEPVPVTGAGEAPLSPIEEILARIWSDVLGIAPIGRHAGFFDLGGHSLMATQVVSRIRAELAVDLPLRAFFDAPTVARLAEEVERSRRSEERREPPPILRIPRDGRLPLSFAQQRLWFLDQLDPASSLYNIPSALRLVGSLDLGLLSRCFTELVRRHEALRTTFAEHGGEPRQEISAPAPMAIPAIDLSGLSEPVRTRESGRLAAEEAWRPFALNRGPLMRVSVLRLGERDHLLLLTLHHVVSDGWSMEILKREMAALYSAFGKDLPSPLLDLDVQYPDFAHWQRSWLQGDVLEAELAFWRERLAGAPTILALPLDRPRPPVPGERGAILPFHLPLEVDALARSEGATVFMTLLAAFQVLLARWSGQEDILVGTPIANRTRVELEPLIGFFVNTLVLRADLSAAGGFLDLLRQVRAATLDAFSHQELPFELLVEDINPERRLGRTPLFQVMMTVQRAESGVTGLADLEILPWPLPTAVSKFDLTLSVTEGGEGLAGALEYDTDLFDETTIVRLAEQLRTLLAAAVVEPASGIWDLPLLSEALRDQILLEWSGAGAPQIPRRTVVDLFQERASASPLATALVVEDQTLTYADLQARAHRLARALGVTLDQPVAVCVSRSAEMVVGLLGILQAGGIYLPLDPAQPAARLLAILDDAGAPPVLVQRSLAARFAGYKGRVVEIESLGVEAEEGQSIELPVESAAYLLYTSGSTGRPKGVLVPHWALAAHALAASRQFGLGAEDRVLQFASPAFDVALEEILPTLISGGAVVLSQEALGTVPELLRFLEDRQVTVVNLPASYWHAWVSEMETSVLPSSLRLAVVGSEPMLPQQARLWMEKAGKQAGLINAYGITEATITTAAWNLPAGEDLAGAGSVPVGRPLDHARVYVLDRTFRPVPPGVAGELFIGGAVARGYLGRPDLTAERFVADPFGREPGARLYRTGDLGRFRADGTLEILGRIDQQVKIRGVRIEPGEVELALASHPGLRQAVVIAAKGPRETRLIAYAVPAEGSRLTGRDLQGFLRDRLPAAMVPGDVVLLPALPLTTGGKVDRKALPEPRQDQGAAVRQLPRTEVEELIAGLWAEVLQLDGVDVETSFFDLGGHSLLATQLLSRIRASFRVELPLRRLFEGPTVAELARAVEEAMRASDGIVVEPCRPAPRSGPLPLSFAQQRLWLVDQLEPGSSRYNLPSAYRLSGDLSLQDLRRSLDELVRRHESLRVRFGLVDGEPVQWIDEPGPAALPLIDLSGLPEPRREGEARRLALEESRRPFDLARGPLIRSVALRVAETDHILLLTLHHIVTDGWSMGILARDLTSLYTASPLPELPVQYADFALWQRRWLQGETLETLLSYWRRQLAEPLQPLRLPSDRPRPSRPTHRGAWVRMSLEPDLAAGLRGLARSEGATLFTVLLAAFKVVLRNLARTDEVVIGTNVANRTRRETEDLIGFFLNLLVVRTDLSGRPSFRELLARVRRVTLDAYTHQDLPFDLLVDALNPRREIPDQPLFQVKIDMQNTPSTPAPAASLPDVALKGFDVEPGFTHNDLALHISEPGDRLELNLLYSLDLFDAPRVRGMLEDYRAVLSAVVADPEATLASLDENLDVVRRERESERRREFKDSVRSRLRKVQRKPDPADSGKEERA